MVGEAMRGGRGMRFEERCHLFVLIGTIVCKLRN